MGVIFDIGNGNFIILVILRLQADGERLELHVQIFGDQNRALRILVLDIKAERQNPIVWMIEIAKNLMKAAKFLICAEGGKKLVYRNPNGAAAGGFGAA